MKVQFLSIQSFESIKKVKGKLELNKFFDKNENLLEKFKNYFKKKQEEKRLKKIQIEKTKEIVDRLVNLKLDIKEMSLRKSYSNKYEKMCKNLERINISNFDHLSTPNILEHLSFIDKFINYYKKEDLKEEELFLKAKNLQNKLVYLLCKTSIAELIRLDERVSYFISTQEKGALYDEKMISVSIDDLLKRKEYFENSYDLYLKYIKNSSIFNDEKFNELLENIDNKTKQILVMNPQYIKKNKKQ